MAEVEHDALVGAAQGGDVDALDDLLRRYQPRLFRFGLERPSRLVITEFLGGPITPAAILRDMARLKG